MVFLKRNFLILCCGLVLAVVCGCAPQNQGYITASLSSPAPSGLKTFAFWPDHPIQREEALARLYLKKMLSKGTWLEVPSNQAPDFVVFTSAVLEQPITFTEENYVPVFQTHIFSNYSLAEGKYILQPNYGLPAYQNQLVINTGYGKKLTVSIYKVLDRDININNQHKGLMGKYLEPYWQGQVFSFGQSQEWGVVMPYMFEALAPVLGDKALSIRPYHITYPSKTVDALNREVLVEP